MAPGNGDRERREQGQVARAGRCRRRREGERGQQDRGAVRPALPVAHLARMKAAEILRAERTAEQRHGSSSAISRARRWVGPADAIGPDRRPRRSSVA